MGGGGAGGLALPAVTCGLLWGILLCRDPVSLSPESSPRVPPAARRPSGSPRAAAPAGLAAAASAAAHPPSAARRLLLQVGVSPGAGGLAPTSPDEEMSSSRLHCGRGPRRRAAGPGTAGAGHARGWRPVARVAGSHHEQQEELLPAHLVGIPAPGLRVPGVSPVPRANQSVCPRFRKQRKAMVSANDKMPNGILEEQGTVQGPGAWGAGRVRFLATQGAAGCLLFEILNSLSFETPVPLCPV